MLRNLGLIFESESQLLIRIMYNKALLLIKHR